MGKATILGFSPNLAAMISSGGRISTMEGTAGQIWQKSLELGEEKNERLIGKVVSSGHTSVLEHGYVNLSFENVSVFAEQFLIEFRLASFTVKSRRYVDFSNCGWVTPFEDAARAEIYDAEVRRLFGVYDALCAGQKETLLAAYRMRLNCLGRAVTVHTPAGTYPAVCESLDDTGALIVRTADGETHALRAGEISIRL